MASQTPRLDEAAAQPLPVDLARIKEVLEEIIRKGGLDLRVKVDAAPHSPDDNESPEWFVELSGYDAPLVLESHAALLEALASIALKAARVDEIRAKRIAFDCEHYRRQRATEIRLMARMAADRAAESHEPFAMSPMNAAERRLAHLALRDDSRVRTESQGDGPGRRVMIYPLDSRAKK